MAFKQRIRNIIWSHTLLVWALGVCPALSIVRCYPALPYSTDIAIQQASDGTESNGMGMSEV